jgi:hypothetical protein
MKSKFSLPVTRQYVTIKPRAEEISPVAEFLYLGTIAGAKSLTSQNPLNIRRILNCTDVPYELAGISVTSIQMDDHLGFQILDVLPAAVTVLVEAIEAQEPILVHCQAGISRSATVVIAYLMLQHRYTYNTALQYLKTQRWNVSPNFGFELQMYALAAALRGCTTFAVTMPPATSPDTSPSRHEALFSSNAVTMMSANTCAKQLMPLLERIDRLPSAGLRPTREECLTREYVVGSEDLRVQSVW